MTEYLSSRKYLLPATSTADDVGNFAEQLGWPRLASMPENAENMESHECIWGKDEGLLLHYRQDFITKSPCSFATGSSQDRVNRLAHFIEQHFNPATPEELLEAAEHFRELDSEFSIAILRLGLGAPEKFDERIASLILEATRHSNPEVRNSAVWATSYIYWPQFIPILYDLADHDSSRRVRSAAAQLRDAYTAEEESGE